MNIISGPFPGHESKGAICSEKGKTIQRKGKNAQRYPKNRNLFVLLEKGSLMCDTFALMKGLQYTQKLHDYMDKVKYMDTKIFPSTFLCPVTG